MIILSFIYINLAKLPVFFLAKQGESCILDAPNRLFFIPPWWEYVKGGVRDGIGKCEPKITGPNGKFELTDLLPIGLAVLDIMLRLAGFVAVIAIIVSGIKYITSEGNPEKAAGARKWLYNSLIGLAIVFVASAVITFLGNTLASK